MDSSVTTRVCPEVRIPPLFIHSDNEASSPGHTARKPLAQKVPGKQAAGGPWRHSVSAAILQISVCWSRPRIESLPGFAKKTHLTNIFHAYQRTPFVPCSVLDCQLCLIANPQPGIENSSHYRNRSHLFIIYGNPPENSGAPKQNFLVVC